MSGHLTSEEIDSVVESHSNPVTWSRAELAVWEGEGAPEVLPGLSRARGRSSVVSLWMGRRPTHPPTWEVNMGLMHSPSL